MSAIEDSLRRALANGNAHDPAYRESIYAASERALERMIGARALDPEAADDQRRKLIGTIERVEAEYAGAPVAAPAPAGFANPEPAAFDDPDHGRAPASFAPTAAAPATETEGAEWRPASIETRPPAPRARRGLILAAIAFVILLAIIFYVASAVFGTGETVAPEADPAPAQQGGETTGELTPPATPPVQTAEQPTELNWISVFSGDELEALTAPAGGRVEAVEAEGVPLVRISSQNGAAPAPASTGDEATEITLALGPGLVGEITGSPVRIEIRAGSPDGSLREFSVRCQFGTQSVCDRQRFATMMGEEAFVFDVEIPADAETPASLAIAPGLGAEGADIDLYSVRMRVL